MIPDQVLPDAEETTREKVDNILIESFQDISKISVKELLRLPGFSDYNSPAGKKELKIFLKCAGIICNGDMMDEQFIDSMRRYSETYNAQEFIEAAKDVITSVVAMQLTWMPSTFKSQVEYLASVYDDKISAKWRLFYSIGACVSAWNEYGTYGVQDFVTNMDDSETE
jgi:DNA topoisomerase VI subunit B